MIDVGDHSIPCTLPVPSQPIPLHDRVSRLLFRCSGCRCTTVSDTGALAQKAVTDLDRAWLPVGDIIASLPRARHGPVRASQQRGR
jgi:hypothetical protein